ncbi:MAG: hypothetical protein L0I76_31075 [Pseudonocardia sp.]|nr:hypothetical protein [Pseudonocardia sp.]
MLKKAGIVAAAALASLLAVSPLAFAGEDGHDGGHGGHHGAANVVDKDSEGLVSVLNGNNVNVPIQACNNNIPVNVLGVQVPVEDVAGGNGLTGALGLLGSGEAESGNSVTLQPDNCDQDSAAGDSIG